MSLSRLWSGASAALLHEAETRLLALSGLPRSAMGRASVPVDGGRRAVNTIICGPLDAPPVVLVHGYGTASAYWYRNLAALARGNRVYAVDLMGMGRSSKAPLPAVTAGDEPSEADLDAVEDYFVEPLLAWADALGLDRFVLAGHSFGGYVASLVALRAPERLHRLLLVSPFGVPRVQPRRERTGAARAVFGAVERGWAAGVTPNGVVRALGPAGRRAVEWMVRQRMRSLPDEDRDAMSEYTFQLWGSEVAGEAALHALFHPPGYARRPLAGRLGAVRVPTHFLYGEFDWMDWRAAQRVIDAQGDSGGGFLRGLTVVPASGHNLFLDNPPAFNAAVRAQLEDARWVVAAPPTTWAETARQ